MRGRGGGGRRIKGVRVEKYGRTKGRREEVGKGKGVREECSDSNTKYCC